MTEMAIFFVSITLLVVASVAVLLWPLLRTATPESADRRAVNLAIAKQRLRELGREQDNGILGPEAYEQAKAELELTLAGDLDDSESGVSRTGGRWMAALVVVMVPVLTGWLYFKLGSPLFLDEQVGTAQNGAASAPEMPAEIAELVTRLEQRMQESPDDPEGQRLLVRTYMAQQRFDDAVKALESWGAREGDNADLLVMLADASGARSGGRLIGEPEDLLQRALAIDPQHRQALWIMGYAQAQKNNAVEAVGYWERLLPLVEAEPEAKAEVSKVIADMRTQAGLAPSDPAPQQPSAADAGQGLTVQVALDPDLAGKVSGDLAVFVYAKTPTGPPMPLAVVKRQVSDLPLTVTLDDSTAMIPTHVLSGQQQVTVGARVSLGGGPVAQPGDLYIEQADVPVSSEAPLSLVINQIK